MQTTDDSRPWPLVWLAVLRCALGLRSHDHHVFFVEDGSQCWRSYVLWGRWMTLRRSTCRDADRPHERAIEYAGYRNAARLEGAVRNVRGVLLAALAMIVLALAFAGWQRTFLGDLPGRNGEPLPRDWRASRPYCYNEAGHRCECWIASDVYVTCKDAVIAPETAGR